MVKSIVCYTLGNIEPKKRLRFNQELYGYTSQSHHGRYKYIRQGILSNINYEKPLDAILVLPTKMTQKVLRHLKKYKSKCINYQIKA